MKITDLRKFDDFTSLLLVVDLKVTVGAASQSFGFHSYLLKSTSLCLEDTLSEKTTTRTIDRNHTVTVSHYH